MTDVIVRETTTIPGIVNLIGALVLLNIRPAAGVLDKLIVFFLMTISAFRKHNAEYQENLKKVIERLLPEEGSAGATLVSAGLMFIGYNVICMLVVGST